MQPNIICLKYQNNIQRGLTWQQIFPGISSINVTTNGYGPSLDFRFTKQEGIPIHTVPEGTPGSAIVAIKKVNELDYYNLGRDQLAKKAGITGLKTTGVVEILNLKADHKMKEENQIIISSSRDFKECTCGLK